MARRQKKDQADAVVRVILPRDDFEAGTKAIQRANHKAVEEIDRVNATRKGKHKLRPNGELAFLDAAGNKEFVIPIGKSRSPEFYFDKEIDPKHFPNFAYVVAKDERGEKIVVRIEFERATVQ
jgi:hypothetical protein